jgi:hypothetical protein
LEGLGVGRVMLETGNYFWQPLEDILVDALHVIGDVIGGEHRMHTNQ